MAKRKALRKEVERLQAERNRSNGLLQEAEQIRVGKTQEAANRAQEAANLAEERKKLLVEVDKIKGELIRKDEDFVKATDFFKQDTAQSYLVGFEAALEQAATVHPSMDLSTLDPGKTVVDSQLTGKNLSIYGL